MNNPNYQQQQPIYVAQKTSGLAIVSLVFGILDIIGFAFCGGFLVAIICGHAALAQIRKSNGVIGGHGMALAGLILGYASAAIVIGIVGFMLITGSLFQAKMLSDINKETVRQEKVIEEKAKDYSQFIGKYHWNKNDAKNIYFHISAAPDNHLLMEFDSDQSVKCDLSPKISDMNSNEVEFDVSGCMQKLSRKPKGASFSKENGKVEMTFWFEGEYGFGRSTFEKVE